MSGTETSGLFGVRLGHGLHLGHLVGNVRPAIKEQESRRIVVVLADLFTLTSNRRKDLSVQNLLNVTAECMALGLDHGNVRFVIQSEAFGGLLPFYALLASVSSFDKLRRTRPVSSLIQSKEATLGEISFPLMQCAEMLITNADVLYSNIDNLGLVAMAKSAARKLSAATGTRFVEPQLRLGDPKTVRGVDYAKMSNARGNAIFLSDSPSTVARKVVRIRTDSNGSSDFDLSLVFEYLQIVCSAEELAGLQAGVTGGIITALQAKNVLIDRLNELFAAVAQRRDQYLADPSMLLRRISVDTDTVRADVMSRYRDIRGRLYDFVFDGTVPELRIAHV